MICASQVVGQATVFFSTVDTIGGGATVGNASLTVPVNQPFDLAVWVAAPNGLTVSGLALDVSESVDLLGADSWTVIEGGPVQRWLVNTVTPGDLNASATLLVDDSDASGFAGVDGQTFSLSGDPVTRGNDANFDPAVGADGAFLHSILTLTPHTTGVTDLFLGVGAARIGYVPDGDTDLLFGTGDAAVDRTVAGAISATADAAITVVAAQPGDFDGDGDVDLDDFNRLAANFGLSPGATLGQGDANGDGTVDLDDFNILAANFGAGTSNDTTAPLPEPGCLSLLCIALGLRRPRRDCHALS